MQHRGLINHHHSTELFKEIDIDAERLASEYFVSILTPQANISALHTGGFPYVSPAWCFGQLSGLQRVSN